MEYLYKKGAYVRDYWLVVLESSSNSMKVNRTSFHIELKVIE